MRVLRALSSSPITALAIVSGTASIVLAATLMACLPVEEEEIRGESIGSYRFAGALVENTCGHEAVPTEEEITMDVELRREGSLGVWRPPGGAILHGSVVGSEAAEWIFRSYTAYPLYDYDPITGIGPCTINQTETIRFTPAAGDETDDASYFQGSSSLLFAPSQDSNCGASTLAQGGPFYSLPCEVSYVIASESIDALFNDVPASETSE